MSDVYSEDSFTVFSMTYRNQSLALGIAIQEPSVLVPKS